MTRSGRNYKLIVRDKLYILLLFQVVTYPFDNRFLNYEDPEVLKLMTSGKDMEKNWKEVYGVDFVSHRGDQSEVKHFF